MNSKQVYPKLAQQLCRLDPTNHPSGLQRNVVGTVVSKSFVLAVRAHFTAWTQNPLFEEHSISSKLSGTCETVFESRKPLCATGSRFYLALREVVAAAEMTRREALHLDVRT